MAASLPYPGPDVNRGPELLSVIWIFTTLALITVVLKLYTRYSILRETGLDDLLIFFSTLLILVCTIIFTVDVQYGMGRHTYYLSPEEAVKAAYLNYIGNPFGIMAYSIPNISIAIFVNRILNHNKWERWTLYGLAILQNVIAAISCVLLFVQCTPTASLWNPAVIPTSCLNANTLVGYSYFVGAFTAFTDVVLAVVPIMSFRKLQMKRNLRIAISILMGFTLVAAICAIVKTSKLNELADIADFTYASVDLIITAVVEADVIIIASCIPTLRPFVKSVNESISSSVARRLEGRSTNKSDDSGKNWLKLSSLGKTQPSTSNVARSYDASLLERQSAEDQSAEHGSGSIERKIEITSTEQYIRMPE